MFRHWQCGFLAAVVPIVVLAQEPANVETNRLAEVVVCATIRVALA